MMLVKLDRKDKMRYDFAKRLHSGDEIRVKKTKEITKVIYIEIEHGDRAVHVYAVTRDGFTKLQHTEIA
jgi:hypothetical protein